MEHSNELENSTCPKCGSTQIKFNKNSHKIIILAKIILVICVCISIVLVSYGSTRSVLDTSAGIFMGIGASFAAIAVGIAIFIFIKDSKSTTQAICKDCGEIWQQKK